MKVNLTKATFKAPKYMHFETNQFGPLVQKLYGKQVLSAPFDAIGSDSVMINLDAIDGGNIIETHIDGDKKHETHYVVPIADEAKALDFKAKCSEVGMEVEIGTYEEAMVLWSELKALKPKKVEV